MHSHFCYCHPIRNIAIEGKLSCTNLQNLYTRLFLLLLLNSVIEKISVKFQVTDPTYIYKYMGTCYKTYVQGMNYLIHFLNAAKKINNIDTYSGIRKYL